MAWGDHAYTNESSAHRQRKPFFSACHAEKQVQILDWEKRLCRYSDGKHSQDCREAHHKIRVMNVGGDAVCLAM
jgi:hypothetical protein